MKPGDLIRSEDPIQIDVEIYIAKIQVREPLTGRLDTVRRHQLLADFKTNHRALWSSPRQFERELGVRAPKLYLQRRLLRERRRPHVGVGSWDLKIEPQWIYMLAN